MSALFGYLSYDHGNREVTRTARRLISAVVKTWKGQVCVELTEDGGCTITIRELKGSRQITVFRGNIDKMWEKDEPKPTVTLRAKGDTLQIHGPDWINVKFIEAEGGSCMEFVSWTDKDDEEGQHGSG